MSKNTKRRVGRPEEYVEIADRLAAVVKAANGNVSLARKILVASGGINSTIRERVAIRRAAGLPNVVRICGPTLRKYAERAGVKMLSPGRPSLAAAA